MHAEVWQRRKTTKLASFILFCHAARADAASKLCIQKGVGAKRAAAKVFLPRDESNVGGPPAWILGGDPCI